MSKEQIVYNEVSKSLRPTPLKKGERRTYCVYGSYDKKTGKPLRLLSALVFPNTDVIWDNVKEEYVPIALLDGRHEDGSPKLMDLVIDNKMANLIVVQGGRAKDHAIYEYFELTNFNADNKLRDQNKEALIEVFDRAKFAKQARLERIQKRDAMIAAENYSDEEVIAWMTSKQRASTRNMEVMRDEIELYAQDHPTEFLTKEEGNQADIELKLREAAKRKIISHNKETGAWEWPDGSTICPTKKGAAVRIYDALLSHVVNEDGGDIVLGRIIKELEK